MTQLDKKLVIEIEANVEGTKPPLEKWSLRDLLKMVTHEEKPLFRAIANLKEGTVMTIVCTGKGRDDALTHIALSTAAWTMYNLMFEHNTTGESIKAALMAWFSCIHKTAVIDFSEFNQETGKVSLLGNVEGE